MTDDYYAPVARRYTAAYAAFDTDTPRELPAAHLHLRQVDPSGYLGLDSADADIDGTADFRRGFDSRASAATADVIGDRIASAPQMSLTATGRDYLMEHQQFVTVENGAASFQRG
jgi:hypothetical protein